MTRLLARGYTVVTDSLRRVVRNFGEIRIDYSQTQTASRATDHLRRRHRLHRARLESLSGSGEVLRDSECRRLVVRNPGILGSPARFGTGLMPFSAIDGNLATMWESDSATAIGKRIRIRFLAPLNPHTIRVAFADTAAVGPPVARVVVTTAAGQVTDACPGHRRFPDAARPSRPDEVAPDHHRGLPA